MRTRKNITCLTTNELHDLREAFARLYQLPESNPLSYARIAGLHGNPRPSYCKHGNTGFLTWHRAYLLELENALRTIHCNVTLPYWNWSSGSPVGLPAAFRNPTYQNRAGATVDNPLFRGPIAPSAGGGFTSRRSNIDTTTFGDISANMRTAMTTTTWNAFIGQLNGNHGSIHVRIGGNMSSVATAAYDPIFHFHHCNVDRLGANWQAQHPGQVPNAEINLDLEPFTRPFTNTWHRGGDFEHIQDLDYNYRNWCFIRPDWRFTLTELDLDRLIKFPFPLPEIPEFDGRTRLRLQRPMMTEKSMELRVFVNTPKADVDTPFIDNPNFAGSFGIFGMGGAKMMEHAPIDLQIDVTDALKRSGKKRDKEVIFTLVPVFDEAKKKTSKAMKMPAQHEAGFDLSVELE